MTLMLPVATLLEAHEQRVARVPTYNERTRAYDGPTHAEILKPHLTKAIRQLAGERFGRCLCNDVRCQAGQVSLRAWHLYWRRRRQRRARKLRRARKKVRGW